MEHENLGSVIGCEARNRD